VTAEAGPSAAGTVALKAQVRRVVGPLLSYHVLLLVGAFLLVDGYGRGQESWVAIGVTLIIVGIVVEIAVLGWAASLARHSPAASVPKSPDPNSSTLPRPQRLCTSCGWKGRVRSPLCPRCQRLTVPLF
jgi:uncharacterized membrane protein